ncbi:uncharacterized protein [Watersipora subatra]|uniref:uncharacterized protein isoform X2 n=1 Tax=Watersipora subatra TaxID=2589382 RepID=UPI00355C80B6
MGIAQAIEKNLIQGELVSVNMDGGEYSSFQATADNVEHVRDPRTHKTITYDAACKLGLIDRGSKTFHNPITDQTLSLDEAARKGFIKKKSLSTTPTRSAEPEIRPKAVNAVEAHKEKFANKRNIFEGSIQRDGFDYFDNPISGLDESMRVEETKTMETEYMPSEVLSRPVIQSSSLDRNSPHRDPQLLNRVDAVLDRAKLYTHESVISSTETHMSGYTTDWQAGRVYNLRTGDELTLDEAVEKGILDAKQVRLMKRYKQGHSPSVSAESSLLKQRGSIPKDAVFNGLHDEYKIEPSHQPPTRAGLESRPRGSREPSLANENTSMVVKVSQMQHCQSRIGPLSYNAAVRLGLFNIKTGKYRDPISGLVLGIQDAVSKGFIQANSDAITNLNTGTPVSLADCIQRNLIDSETGKIFESKLKQLNIAVANHFLSSRSARNAPINFEDALKVGLLNPYTGEFQHPQSDETSTIGDAVTQQYIAGKSVVVQDPTSGNRFYLDDALRRGIVNPNNGDIFDVLRGERVMTLYEALKTKLFESVYDPFDSSLLDPNNGQRVDVGQAVKRSLLGHNTCIVYDTDKHRQVSFDSAVEAGILDRAMGTYIDKKGGRRLICQTAAEMGLIEPIGAPVLNKLRVLESIHKLYAPPGDSISAPSYTMYEDVKSREVSTIRQPEIRTEVDMQEYKTERTIKLSGKTEGQKSDMIDLAPGDKVLVPRPFKPGRAAPPPVQSEPLLQRPSQQKPAYSPVQKKPSYGSHEAVEEPIARKAAQLYYDEKNHKDPVSAPTLPADEPESPMLSPDGHKIISVTEEFYETVETKPRTKKKRGLTENISAPEYFTKGEAVEIKIEDDEIDDYKMSVKTAKPPQVEWDLTLTQQPGKEQKVTKVVEETVEEEMLDPRLRDMQITVESTETKAHSPPIMDEPVQPIHKPPVQKEKPPAQRYSPPVQRDSPPMLRMQRQEETVQRREETVPSPLPHRIRDKEIIIIEREGGNVTKNISINIDSALDEGYIDLTRREFTHPTTGETMSLVEAIRRGLIQGSNDEIRNGITRHYEKLKMANLKQAIMEYSTRKEFSSFVEKEQKGLPLSDCIVSRALDPRSGKYTDPKSGMVYTLKEAVNHEMIDGESAHFTNPGNKKVYTLKEALDKNILDKYGKWTSPLTGQKLPFSDAIKKGHVKMISSEQTINKMTTITELKKVRVDYVVHPVTTERISYNQALVEGIISTVDGIYRNPSTNDTLSLDDAVKHGLICGEVLDVKRKTEERILDATNIVARSVDEADINRPAHSQHHESNLQVIRSPMRSYIIDTVVDPRTKNTITAGEAIKLGIIDPSTATYHNILTGEQMTFEDAIKRQLLRCMETTDLPDGEKFNILGVICPQTGEEISLSQALDDGVIDFKRGVYVNTVTRNTISLADAIDRKLMRVEGRLPEGMTSSKVRNEEQEDVTNAVYTEQKSYTITRAKDTRTDETVSIKEAVRLGILDADLSSYKDLHTGKVYTIQEAIDEGLLVATLDDPNSSKTSPTDTSMTVNTTKRFDIEAVVDPKTQEEVSAKEAVSRGIIDEATGCRTYLFQLTGDYVNVDTMESWSMDKAIKQGLVKAKPIPAHDTVSFSIAAIIDPKTGERMTVSDALRHGFLDRGRKTFCNAHTGQVCSLDEALHSGWIITKSNYDKSKTKTGLAFKGQPGKAMPGATIGPSGFQTFTILSVLNAKTGEDLPVMEAVRLGILDNAKRNYKDTLTGEVMLLDTAVKRNFIKLGPSSFGITKTTFAEALKRGYINTQTGKYACPSTGQVMSVDEAVRRGLLVDDAGQRLGSEDTAVKPAKRQSRTFESALRDGIIDSRSGKFVNPESGEAMTLGRAVNQGHLAPRTQWRAYSYKTQQMAGPPSPGSVISSASQKAADPIYSTIHKNRTMSSSLPRDTGPMDIYSAKDQGLINMQTGEITLPQYGTSMLLDDALMQGLLVTKVPISAILSKPAPPNSMSVHQAFQQGFINPLNLSMQNSNRQFISFEDALASGLLYPRASSSMRREGSVAREGTLVKEPASQVRAASMPPTGTLPNSSYSYRKQTIQQSSGPSSGQTSGPKNMSPSNPYPSMNGSSMMNGGAHLKPGMGTLPPNFSSNTPTTGTQQRRVWEKQTHVQQRNTGANPSGGFYNDQPAQSQSPLLNGNAHFINGKLFASRPGYTIDGNGAVVNIMTRETLTLAQAIAKNIVQKIPDDEYDAGTLPPNNSMYNRDPTRNATASAATHVTELPIISAQVADAEFNSALQSVQTPALSSAPPLKPPRVSFPSPATGPVQSEFYSTSSEQYYSQVHH